MKKVNYILANGAKFHHFSIAKILHQRKQLSKIICGYPWFKLKNEKIPRRLVDLMEFSNFKISYFKQKIF